jgi:hypothetical protein
MLLGIQAAGVLRAHTEAWLDCAPNTYSLRPSSREPSGHDHRGTHADIVERGVPGMPGCVGH